MAMAHFTEEGAGAQRAGAACSGKSWGLDTCLFVPCGPDASSPLGGKKSQELPVDPQLSARLLWQPPSSQRRGEEIRPEG